MTNPIIGILIDEVQQTRGAMQSATVLINGFSTRLEAAVQQALENGATQDQLAPLTELEAGLEQERQALSSAVAANS